MYRTSPILVLSLALLVYLHHPYFHVNTKSVTTSGVTLITPISKILPCLKRVSAFSARRWPDNYSGRTMGTLPVNTACFIPQFCP